MLVDKNNDDSTQKVVPNDQIQTSNLEKSNKLNEKIIASNNAKFSKQLMRRRRRKAYIIPLIPIALIMLVLGIVLLTASKRVTVSFVVDSVVVKQVGVDLGKPVDEILAPEVNVEGFDFTGWYVDEYTTVRWTFSTPIEKDTRLYAGLTPQSIAMRVYLNDGTESYYDIIAKTNSEVELLNQSFVENNLSQEFRDNYTLIGFSSDVTSTEPEYLASERINLTEGIMYAIWEGNPVDISLFGSSALLNGGIWFEGEHLSLSYNSVYTVNVSDFDNIYQSGTGARVLGFNVSVNGGEPVLYTHGQEIKIVNNMEFELAFDGTVNKAVLDFSDATDDIGAEAEYFGVGTIFEFPNIQRQGYILSGYTIGASQTIMSLDTPIVVGEGVTTYIPYWVGEDRTITWFINQTQITTTIKVGQYITFDEDTPTRTQDAQYTYTFKGWNASEDTTLTTGQTTDIQSILVATDSTNESYSFFAVFNPLIRSYATTWLSQDGSQTYLVNEDVEYGTPIAYTGVEPIKAATAQYTYTFVGWATSADQEIGDAVELLGEVIGDQTYYAAFSKVVNQYTITWLSQDGEDPLETDANQDFGNAVSFNGVAPTKDATAQYTYTFAGWATSANQESGVAMGSLPTVGGDATYYAAFSKEINKYTVTWLSQDGNTPLETDANVNFGTAVSFDSAEPTKAATAEFTYTFAGWATSANQESGVDATSLPTVGGTITYYAAFSKVVNKYTITWLSQDGSQTYLVNEDVEYGTPIAYTGVDPIKAATAQYTYTFKGWATSVDQEEGVLVGDLGTVVGNHTYYAAFSKVVNQYTITWLSQDGEDPLETDFNQNFGTLISFDSAEPTKDATPQYTYTFAGWATSADQEEGVLVGDLGTVVGDQTYYAAFSKVVNKYTVTWMSQDGSTPLETDNNVNFGTAVSFDSAEPTKAATAEFTYTFAGWATSANQESGVDATSLPTVEDHVTYYAAFSKVVNKYTITWLSQNGSQTYLVNEGIEYGTPIAYTGVDPIKAATAQYTYTFAGWATSVDQEEGVLVGDLGTVVGDQAYYAAFSKVVNQYTITWLSQDGETDLEIDEYIEYGKPIEYTGVAPTKDATPQYTYTFAGWATSANQESGVDAELLGNVIGHKTYYAAFSKVVNKYTVTWMSQDGSTPLETDNNVNFGTAVSFDKPNPTKAATPQYTYTFAGWATSANQESGVDATSLPTVEDHVTYYAAFSKVVNKYTITWLSQNGSQTYLVNEGIEYGEPIEYTGVDPIKAATAQYTYTFAGWATSANQESGTPAVSLGTVVGDQTYYATFSRVVNKYIITWLSQDGEDPLETDEDVAYGLPVSFNGTEPTKEQDAQYTYTFAGWATSANQETGVLVGDLGTVVGDQTYYAAFSKTLRSYIVSFDLQDAIKGATGDDKWELEEEFINYGSYYTIPAQNASDGAGRWYTGFKIDGEEPLYVPGNKILITGNVRLVLQFSNTATFLIIDTQGANEAGGIYYATQTLPTLTKTGYILLGYATRLAPHDDAIIAENAGAIVDPEEEGITYYAIWKGEDRTITWKNGDTTLSTDIVLYGETPVYGGATPTKEQDAQYTYTFAGWNTTDTTDTTEAVLDVIPLVNSNAIYYAVFNKTLRTYTITWKTQNGSTTLETDEDVAYGLPVSFDGTEPTKEQDAQYTYTFAGWATSINQESGTQVAGLPTVGGTITYYAAFNKTIRSYTITWLSQDGGTELEVDENVNYGLVISFNATAPTKAATAQYTYTFAGWATSANQESGIDAELLGTVIGNQTYYAAFSKVVNQYTIIWMSQDGSTTLETDNNVNFGTAVSFDSAEPTKAATAQYTYTFAGWATSINQETGTAAASLPAVGETITYYAAFSKVVNQYTIIWKSQDGSTTLETDANINFGTAVSFNGTEPTKAATAQYTYTFEGWATSANQEEGIAAGSLPTVGENQTYYAAFSKTLRNYTVTWKSQNGAATLETDNNVDFGTQPLFNDEEPTKPATLQYTYTFAGWATSANQESGVAAASLPTVDGNVTYYAAFRKETNTYTIIWMSQDGTTELEVDENIEYGTTLSFDGSTPTKPATPQYTYTFAGWATSTGQESGVPAVSLPILDGNVTYYAAFSKVVNQYTVTWKTQDGGTTLETDNGVNFGTQPSFNGSTPTKAQDAQYTYAFAGWATVTGQESGVAMGSLPTVGGHITYYATFSKTIRSFTIIWKSQDGNTTLETDINVNYGTALSYDGTVQTKAPTAQYTYTFAGWNTNANQEEGVLVGDLPAANKDITYYAAFSKVTNQYTVIWKSQDGVTTIETDYNVNFGTAVSFNATAPTKPATAQYTYTFAGWATSANQESGTAAASLPTVGGNATYYAAFSKVVNKYTVTWKSQDGGTTLETDSGVNYGTAVSFNGSTPTKTATAQYTFTFAGWSTTTNQKSGTAVGSLPTVSGNVTYYATFSETLRSYTVTWKSQDGGTTLETDTGVNYGTAVSFNGSAPTKAQDAQYTYSFAGWSTNTGQETGTAAGSLPTVTGAVTYYAAFSKTLRSYAVSFDATSLAKAKRPNSGDAITISSTSLNYGSTYTVNLSTLNINTAFESATGKKVTGVQINGTGTVYTNGTSFTVTGATVLTLAFAANADTLAINYNGGSANGTDAGIANANFLGTGTNVTASTVKKQFYTLKGYCTSNIAWDAAGTIITQAALSAMQVGSGATTYYAIWEPIVVNFTYNANSGTGAASGGASARYGTTGFALAAKNTLAREYYTYLGWSKSSSATSATWGSGGLVNLDSTMLSGASYTIGNTSATITLYAVWQRNQTTISFNYNGGSGSPTSKVFDAGAVIKLGDHVTVNARTGYTFQNGFDTSQSATTPSYTSTGNYTVPDNNLTLYAVWKANDYTVTYDVNGGSGISARVYNISSATFTLTTASRTGHTFTGWKVTSISGTAYSASGVTIANGATINQIYTGSYANITVQAQWSVNSYSISYNLNSGSISSQPTSYTFSTSSQTKTIPNPTRTGHTFTGWTVSGGSMSGTTLTIPASSTSTVALTANWSVNTYSISYNLNGGSISNQPTSYTFSTSSQTKTVPNPTATGRSFTGWTVSGGSMSGTTLTIPANTTGTVTLTANWSNNQYTINYLFPGHGSVTGQPTKYTFSTSSQEITIPLATSSGYTFTGWSTTAGSMKDTRTLVIPANYTGSISLTANFVKDISWNITSAGTKFTYSYTYDDYDDHKYESATSFTNTLNNVTFIDFYRFTVKNSGGYSVPTHNGVPNSNGLGITISGNTITFHVKVYYDGYGNNRASLGGGTYTVTYTDASGATTSFTFSVSEYYRYG